MFDLVVIGLYLLLLVYLGWVGYRKTHSATDYLLAGRKAHPFVMAMSYGSAFISTSAIVGFGGISGLFGMSMMWLVFLNIFMGVFVAFIVLGRPTRNMGQRLDAHTFPELLGRRYQSRFIQVFAGLLIFLFIPLYAAVVIIGGCKFIFTHFGIPHEYQNWVIIGLSLVTAAYVVVGGLKGGMYIEAMQGSVMVLGMAVLLVFSYVKAGGFVTGHQNLTSLSDMVPANLRAIGHRGFTAFPAFGWGDTLYNQWWTLVSTFTLGVGIGVLAQPQLVVRLMSVKSTRELNRAVALGAIFMLLLPGTAYLAGSMSNAYFARHGDLFAGPIVKALEQPGHAMIKADRVQRNGQWVEIKPRELPVVAAASAGRTLTPGDVVQGRSISLYYAPPDKAGRPDVEQIIPIYIKSALPGWYGSIFLLILLAAAMSTASSQFQALGAAMSRDVYLQLVPTTARTLSVSRVAMAIGIVIAILIAVLTKDQAFIARATAIFFGLCGATFLPALIGGLFSRRMTRTAAIWSMLVGFAASIFWLLLVNEKVAGDIGLVQKLTGGKTSLLIAYPNWPVVDPLLVALPLSGLTAIVVSMMSKPLPAEHVNRCFGASTEPEAAVVARQGDW